MKVQAPFSLRGRNPDVLSCIANLSNDEVFTPPEFANEMLDAIASAWAAANDGANIWEDGSVTFLDPCTKSGVFLREITSRLTQGLAYQIPDLEHRVDHILTKQVFGIGITYLTGLLARRSVYCSKQARGEHSIAKSFRTDDGNIWFERKEHTWRDGKCEYCGANQKTLDRDKGLETHAYTFIHTNDIKAHVAELFGGKMQFDVIIGNPPYQLDDGGYGASAAPIYNKFVDQAKALEPRLLSMVIPSRWMMGGKGLDAFRESMLNDNRLRILNDYLSSSDAFPGVELQGGVCFFLWNRDQPGDCRVTSYYKGEVMSVATRSTREAWADVFIRHNQALPVLKKVLSVETGLPMDALASLPEDKMFSRLVSSSKPFGLRTFVKGNAAKKRADVVLYRNGGMGYIARSEVTSNEAAIDKWKVYIGSAHGGQGHGKDVFPTVVIGKPFLGEPGSVCSETYNFIGPFKSKAEAESVISYISTRLFRFLVLLHKPAQHANRAVYSFVPIQDFTRVWTDSLLYKKYKLAKDDIAFIEKMIRPMDLSAEAADE